MRIGVPRDPWLPILLFGVIWAALFVTAWVSTAYLPWHPTLGAWSGFPHRPWLDGWTRWDAGWYREIAERGYSYLPRRQSSVGFFPLYPLIMRWSASVLGDPLLSGIVVTLIAGLCATVLFHRWCLHRMDASDARLALAALLLYPFAYYLFGAVYSDALFLALALASFSLLEAGRSWSAGCVGALATATRPVGPALMVGLFARAIERALEYKGDDSSSDLSAGRKIGKGLRSWAGVTLSPLGLVAYFVYLDFRFGDLLAYRHAQSVPGWEHGFGARTLFKAAAVQQILQHPWNPGNAVIVSQAFLSLAALALIPVVFRRFGWGYGLYALIVVGLPLLTVNDFIGMGRYLLAAFPCYAAAGLLAARRPRWAQIGFAASGLALLVATSLFSRWHYLS